MIHDHWTRESRESVARSAVRWARNMLVDVLGNHGGYISPDLRKAIRDAVEALSTVV